MTHLPRCWPRSHAVPLNVVTRNAEVLPLFARLSANGVPLNALYATTLVGALCFFTSVFGDQTVYLWLLNTSGMTGFIAWLGIAVCHYRFRKAYIAQGRSLAALPYRATLFPFGPLFAFALCLAITLGQNYQAFMADAIDWSSVSRAPEMSSTAVSTTSSSSIWAARGKSISIARTANATPSPISSE